MKIVGCIIALIAATSAAFAQTDSIRRQALDEHVLVSRSGKTFTHKVNFNKKALRHKLTRSYSRGTLETMAFHSLTQPLMIGASAPGRTVRMQSVKCRIAPYDARIFSLYLIVQTGDTALQTRFYCLNSARMEAGWAVYQFEPRAAPVLQSDLPFKLGYTLLITDRRYPIVSYDFYQAPMDRNYPLRMRRKKFEAMLVGRERILSERPPSRHPFVVTYSYVDDDQQD